MFYQYLLSLKSISYRVFFSIIFLLNLHAHAATDFTQLPSKQFNVLLFTKTQGWHHKAIPTGVKALQTLSDKHHFNLIWHEESRYFNADFLANVDVIVFLSTSGDILNNKQQQALQAYMQMGKGFVGIHSASDTEADWPWYQQLIGHSFIIHPTIQTAQLNVIDPTFPGMHFPTSSLFTDEWYEFSQPKSQNLYYLLTVDENSYNTQADWGDKKGKGMGEFHPIAWYQYFAGGRSFYTALGHLPAVYENPDFLNHIYGGIYWAATGQGIKTVKPHKN
ncbi:ThuA domain-containing protein [Algibacillus agarilyticus]|uniref:ThuA domain-containing protein n=1 Tax=Algibacillus agarilyticus TaxID=2234133 RepID=UPI000DCFBF38|nr:ThuA domain-containing protein [Algibacillus agarilyticus]